MPYSNRRPYYGLKLSIGDFFRESVRYLKESNTKESTSEKPYLEEGYPKMHLRPPGFWYKRKPYIPGGNFGEISNGNPGLAHIIFGEAACYWNILNPPYCIKEDQIITITADYFFKADFNFIANIVADSIGVTLSQLPGEEGRAWDDQDFKVSFPENADGEVVICGFASAYVLISQTFEVIVAGMPVGIHLVDGGLVPIERGQTRKSPVLLKANYGTKGANCGCITIKSSCDPCTGITPLSWDSGASATTVARNASVTVAVQDGLGPYNWTVSGTGFSLATAQTSGVSNTLIAGAAACGSATISVTDQCSGSVINYVRCTTGQWGNVTAGCILGGVPDSNVNGSMEKISGKYKQQQIIAGCSGTEIGGCDATDCSAYCGSGGCINCTSCLDWICSDTNLGNTQCGEWCCSYGACDEGSFCAGNSLLRYWEWIC